MQLIFNRLLRDVVHFNADRWRYKVNYIVQMQLAVLPHNTETTDYCDVTPPQRWNRGRIFDP